jgi:hypothetical protein
LLIGALPFSFSFLLVFNPTLTIDMLARVIISISIGFIFSPLALSLYWFGFTFVIAGVIYVLKRNGGFSSGKALLTKEFFYAFCQAYIIVSSFLTLFIFLTLPSEFWVYMELFNLLKSYSLLLSAISFFSGVIFVYIELKISPFQESKAEEQ